MESIQLINKGAGGREKSGNLFQQGEHFSGVSKVAGLVPAGGNLEMAIKWFE